MRTEGFPHFVRFIIIGAVAAAVNVGARAALNQYVAFEWAIVLAFPIALTFAFIANRRWVFTSEIPAWYVSYWRFLLVNLAALVQVWVISVGLARLVFPTIGLTWHAELIAHTVGVLSPVITSYYAHKHYSFKSSAT